MSSTSTPELEAVPTRDRLADVAMELFGRQGFKATTVAQVEAAAGLSAGSGGLYRHFASKRQLLEYGLRRQLANGVELTDFIRAPAPPAESSLTEQLLAIGRAGLRRLEQERDVNRLLVRDLAEFPELLELFREQELAGVFDVLVAWLLRHFPDADPDEVRAVAAVLIDAVSHHWVLVDVFGTHPSGIDETRYLAAAARMAASALECEADE